MTWFELIPVFLPCGLLFVLVVYMVVSSLTRFHDSLNDLNDFYDNNRDDSE